MTVHPRVCGGNPGKAASIAYVAGPSPRVRGKPLRDSTILLDLGSIPACAGETAMDPSILRMNQVHPRVCGGNIEPPVARPWPAGPSPRVRGKRDPLAEVDDKKRSIPACAGETSTSAYATSEKTVHPRVCGGNFGAPRRRSPAPGPSPRVRGKRAAVLIEVEDIGSIPACAGETRRMTPGSVCSAVHPRVCGGNPKQKAKIVRTVTPA